MGRIPKAKRANVQDDGDNAKKQKTIYVDMGHTNVAFAEGVAQVLARKRAQHLRVNGFGKCGRVAFVRIRRSRCGKLLLLSLSLCGRACVRTTDSTDRDAEKQGTEVSDLLIFYGDE